MEQYKGLNIQKNQPETDKFAQEASCYLNMEGCEGCEGLCSDCLFDESNIVKFKEFQREKVVKQLSDFFVFFRNNGEKFVGLTIEQLIDKYICHTSQKK